MILLRGYDEWRVATSQTEEHLVIDGEGEQKDLPEGLSWQRWDCHDEDTRIRLLPALQSAGHSQTKYLSYHRPWWRGIILHRNPNGSGNSR